MSFHSKHNYPDFMPTSIFHLLLNAAWSNRYQFHSLWFDTTRAHDLRHPKWAR